MAVQEALILLLRAASQSSGFTTLLSLSLCVRVYVCVRVALPCLLSPPPHIESPFLLPLVSVLSVPLWVLLILQSVNSFCSVVFLFTSLLVFFGKPDEGRFPSCCLWKRLCLTFLCYLVLLVFAYLSPSYTYPFPGPCSLPFYPPGWGVCGELATQAAGAVENESTKKQNASA